MKVISTVMCDEIRTENNGKDILIGCYNNVLIVPKVPALLRSLFFRILVEPVGPQTQKFHFVVSDPNGKDVLDAKGELTAESPDEPASLNIGAGPIGLNSFGKYRLQWINPEDAIERRDIFMEFVVRPPQLKSELIRIPK